MHASDIRARTEGAGDYDIDDLRNLLRKDEHPDLKAMMDRVFNVFRFLANLTEAEKIVAADQVGRRQAEADVLIAARMRN